MHFKLTHYWVFVLPVLKYLRLLDDLKDKIGKFKTQYNKLLEMQAKSMVLENEPGQFQAQDSYGVDKFSVWDTVTLGFPKCESIPCMCFEGFEERTP